VGDDELSRSGIISEHFRGPAQVVVFAILLLSSCAPEPTTPAKTSLAGVWTSNAQEFALSEIKMTIVQEADGIVSGGWSAKGDGGGGGCLPGIPCNAFGNLIGRNLVSQVAIELLGAGKFEGTLIEPTELRGVFIVGQASDTITFFRTGE
jgi:hypothetical protein